MTGSQRRAMKWVLVVAASAFGGFLVGAFVQVTFPGLNVVPGAVSVAPASFAEVAQKVNASVVSVVSTKIVDLNQLHEDMEFWYPLRPNEDARRKSLGFGSGFILEGEGLVVTNQHVIDESRNITIRLFDGSEYPAEVIGSDSETDLALMRIKPNSRLEQAQLGNSDKLRVGDWVMAVGNPFNYEHSVTVGVVSAKDRKIDENPYERYIQTDAAINFGNSGGPLFNDRGEVIAITTAISTKGRNIGFAIPINFARQIVGQLEDQGRIVRGFLGLTPEQITKNHASVLGLSSSRGILVAEVSPRSAADRAGIQRYDVITEVAGEPVLDRDDFRRKIAGTKPGTEVVLKGVRNGNSIVFNTEISERPSPSQVFMRPLKPDDSAKPGASASRTARAGISVQELTEQHKKMYPDEGTGLLVVEVDPISPAADAGLSVGDVILEINRQRVTSLDTYQRLISTFKPNDPMMMLVANSRNRTRIVALKLEPSKGN